MKLSRQFVRMPAGGLAALLALMAAGCVSDYKLPPNSFPLTQVQNKQFPDYSHLLLGTWKQVSVIDTTVGITILPNVIDRQAELSGITEWKTYRFTPDGLLLLRNGRTTETLVWAVERDQLTLHLRGATEADKWQITLQGRDLFMRSLTDSDTYTLEKQSD